MRSFINLIVLISLYCTACQKDETAALKASNCANCINFQSPQVGQESRYLAFEGEKFWDENPTFSYQKDTLVVRITGQTGDLFQVEEFRTSNPSDLLHHTFQIKSDTLFVKPIPRSNYPDSWLYNAAGAVKFPLNPVNNPVVVLNSWHLAPFGEAYPAVGRLLSYEQLDSNYESLNVYQNYAPMAYDGQGFYALYSRETGIVRSVAINPWQAKGLGWDLLNR